ncbi:winged helix-turn-helix domain-containing protein [Streptomyces rimosus]|uniref:winged helix-turn-helix domain-containing protein n=1 Tax=Streptomyces rimosus TaxID=1927 RepID=UPI002D21D6EC|nr:winged helix-turn-helix domain-containing protein [Streptomyces rimosus]
MHTLPPSRTATKEWLQGLVAGERLRLDEVAQAAELVHRAVIEPGWSHAAASVDGHRASLTRALRDGGVHGLLNSLRPVAAWSPPTLHATYPVDRDLYLRGRGLRLVPSFFCWRTPVAMADPCLPPVLVIPTDRELGWFPADTRTGHRAALQALLGPTRARALAALETTVTNGELARRLGVSDGAASRHVKALRQANLANTRREGNRVLHLLTPLGRALLQGDLPAAPS